MNDSSKLTVAHKLALYGVGAALFLSGAAWAFIPDFDEGGAARLRELKPWLLTAHGLSAMSFVLILGTLLAGHVTAGLRSRRKTTNGLFFFASMGLLTLSGYLLYYIGSEGLRDFVARLHLWLGLAAPLLLVWHLRRKA